MTQTKAIQPINPRPIEDLVDDIARLRDSSRSETYIPLTEHEIQLNQILSVLKNCGCDSMSQYKGIKRIKEILGW